MIELSARTLGASIFSLSILDAAGAQEVTISPRECYITKDPTDRVTGYFVPPIEVTGHNFVVCEDGNTRLLKRSEVDPLPFEKDCSGSATIFKVVPLSAFIAESYGMPVYSSNGGVLGKIEDVVLNPKGIVSAYVVSRALEQGSAFAVFQAGDIEPWMAGQGYSFVELGNSPALTAIMPEAKSWESVRDNFNLQAITSSSVPLLSAAEFFKQQSVPLVSDIYVNTLEKPIDSSKCFAFESQLICE